MALELLRTAACPHREATVAPPYIHYRAPSHVVTHLPFSSLPLNRPLLVSSAHSWTFSLSTHHLGYLVCVTFSCGGGPGRLAPCRAHRPRLLPFPPPPPYPPPGVASLDVNTLDGVRLPPPGTSSLPLRRALLRASAPPPAAAAPPVPDARAELLRLVTPPAGGRGRALPSDTQERVATLVAGLEAAAPPPGGTAFLPAIAGRWSLLYTSRPPSASPIQRAVTGVGSLDVVQELTFDGGAAEASTGRLRNEVRWPGGVLYVCAAITGVEDGRLAIAFDEAWADVHLPWGDKTVRVPYPVPFKLLGSIARGWLDVTHVGGGVRICRGNKGSAFVLVQEGLDEGGA